MKHENIEKAKFEVLESLNIGSKIESITPVSMQGSQLKSHLAKSFNEGSMDTVVGVSNAIYESSKLQSIDEQLHKFSHECSDIIVGAGLKAKLVYAYECIENKIENVILESAKNAFNDLVILEEAEIKSAIRAGALRPFRSLPLVKEIIESTKITTSEIVESDTVVVKHPISYIETVEGSVFFRSGNKVFAMNEKGMVESNAPSQKFAYVSTIVESLTFNATEECFEYVDEELGSFKIDGTSGISRVNEEGVYESLNNAEFIKSMQMIIEGSKLTGRLANADAVSKRNVADALIATSENFENIVVADNIIECYNKTTGNKVIFVDNKTSYHVAVVESVRLPKLIESFTNVKDALRFFENRSGFDAFEMCAHIIEACELNDEEKKANIAEKRNIIEGLAKRRKTLIEGIEECDEEKDKEVIEKLQEVLVSVDEMLITEKQELDALLK